MEYNHKFKFIKILYNYFRFRVNNLIRNHLSYKFNYNLNSQTKQLLKK